MKFLCLVLAPLIDWTVAQPYNKDMFNFDMETAQYVCESGDCSRRSYSQEHWDDMRCTNPKVCEGYPNKYPVVSGDPDYGWDIGDQGNNCQWCPKIPGAADCGVHKQSPIDLSRFPAVTQFPDAKECIDWHWMQYKDDTCDFEDMKGNFEIARHALQMHIPTLADGSIDCFEEGVGRLYPRLDYSKGFPHWWWLARTDIMTPSQHHQHGHQYAAEVTLAHFYSEKNHIKNEMGHVTMFLQDYEDEDPWPFLDKLICQWREEEEKAREQCNLPPAPLYGKCALFRNQTRSEAPTNEPSEHPTFSPTLSPTSKPTSTPTATPTNTPSMQPTSKPTNNPTSQPSSQPTTGPTKEPTQSPSRTPTLVPTVLPSSRPSDRPSTTLPTASPTASNMPSSTQSLSPSILETASASPEGGLGEDEVVPPTENPTKAPTPQPTITPTAAPSQKPSDQPTIAPTVGPTVAPSASPTAAPTGRPSDAPTDFPTISPTDNPTTSPSKFPTLSPTDQPTDSPTKSPTNPPTPQPTIDVDCDAQCPNGNCHRMCNSGDHCCQEERTDTAFCWDIYDNYFPGDQIFAGCNKCCNKPIQNPDNFFADALENVPKTIQCSAYYADMQRYCRPNSCCSNPRSTTNLCTDAYAQYDFSVFQQLCHYCCNPSIDLPPARRLDEIENGSVAVDTRGSHTPPKFANSSQIDQIGQIEGDTEEEEKNIYVMDGKRFKLSEQDFAPFEEDSDEYFHRIHADFKERHRRMESFSDDDFEENYEDVPYWPYEWMLKVGTEYYYRYEGTQFVPPCRQIVHWRVMKDPIRVHKRQIDELNRLLAWRVNPDNCQAETAGVLYDNGNKVNVNRHVQQTSRNHRLVFCECQDWPSKFENDKLWCTGYKDDPNYNRFFVYPYSFPTYEWIPGEPNPFLAPP